MRQVNLTELIQDGDNAITLQYEGDGSLLYQIVGPLLRALGADTRRRSPRMEPLALQRRVRQDALWRRTTRRPSR